MDMEARHHSLAAASFLGKLETALATYGARRMLTETCFSRHRGLMAGRGATNFLARQTVEPQVAADPPELNLAERAALGAWLFTLKQRYDVVGRLGSAAEAEVLRREKARVDAYYERMEEISAAEEAREKLQELFDYSEEMREGAPLDDD